MSEVLADAANEEIARLKGLVGGDPGAPGFAALAEAQRRAGLLVEAEQTARTGLRHRPDQLAGRVALGLALLDLGRIDDARRELGRVLEAVPDQPLASDALRRVATGESAVPIGDAPRSGAELGFDRLDDGELDDAFASAETATDELVDADDIASRAIRTAKLDRPEGVERESASPFTTRSMAELLERQGRAEDARVLRELLDNEFGARAAPPPRPAAARAAPGDSRADAAADRNDVPDPPLAETRAAVIRTLESWLERLRRGVE